MVVPSFPFDKICVACSVLVCCILLLIIWSWKIQTTENGSKLYDQTVLIYSGSNWMRKADVDRTFLRKCNCSVDNCLFTRNITALKDPSQFDAILFIAEHDIVDYVKKIEGTRTPHQIYAILISEPPHMVPDISYLDNKINMTVSYRRDADARFFYGDVIDKVTNESVPKDPVWREPDPHSAYLRDSSLTNLIKGKTKMAAWFVSNCFTVKSRRQGLAHTLQKYVDVDIYGKCGNLTCERNDHKCNDMLERDYKFYLSFENSLCKDYITEKAFKIMELTIVPVVYSGADVAKILPPHSYINAEDFETARDLADYMIFLDSHPEEYIKYFWWKEFYFVTQTHFSCSLCKAINAWRKVDKHAVIDSVQRWHKNGTCRDPKIEFGSAPKMEKNLTIPDVKHNNTQQ